MHFSALVADFLAVVLVQLGSFGLDRVAGAGDGDTLVGAQLVDCRLRLRREGLHHGRVHRQEVFDEPRLVACQLPPVNGSKLALATWEVHRREQHRSSVRDAPAVPVVCVHARHFSALDDALLGPVLRISPSTFS